MSEATAALGDDVGKRLLRKVCRRLLPFMGLLFFINYLDRTNIAFAKLTMSKDLGLTETMFGLASGLFFVGYLSCEIPSNVALHRFGARRWIARIMVTWGLVAAAMAFVPTSGWLYGLRVVLGNAEAGFFPGMLLYLTFWFPRKERVRLTAIFLLAVPISSAVGSPLSAAVIQFGDGLFGLTGWRAMYLIEGFPAIILGLMTWFYLTDRPAQAKWLSAEERTWLIDTMDAENLATAKRFHYPLRRVLTTPRVWGLGMVYFGVLYGLYAVSFFLPTIVAGFAETFDTTYSLLETGLIVAVPFAVAAVAMVAWSRHSDHTGERVWHVAAPIFLGAVSIPVALYLQSPFAVMVARHPDRRRDLLCSAGFLVLAFDLPVGRGSGGGDRPRQLVGQQCRLRGAIHHRLALGQDRQQQGQVVGRRLGHVGCGDSGACAPGGPPPGRLGRPLSVVRIHHETHTTPLTGLPPQRVGT